jgi:hypothetical protein
MWPAAKTIDATKKVLDWSDFSSEGLSWTDDAGTPDIVAYLRRLLERYEESEFIKYLVLPSPVALSGFFHCGEEAIQDALLELQRQGYEVETTGNTGPIVLWDPLIRQNTHRQSPNSWDLFYEAFFPSGISPGRPAR